MKEEKEEGNVEEEEKERAKDETGETAPDAAQEVKVEEELQWHVIRQRTWEQGGGLIKVDGEVRDCIADGEERITDNKDVKYKWVHVEGDGSTDMTNAGKPKKK